MQNSLTTSTTAPRRRSSPSQRKKTQDFGTVKLHNLGLPRDVTTPLVTEAYDFATENLNDAAARYPQEAGSYMRTVLHVYPLVRLATEENDSEYRCRALSLLLESLIKLDLQMMALFGRPAQLTEAIYQGFTPAVYAELRRVEEFATQMPTLRINGEFTHILDSHNLLPGIHCRALELACIPPHPYSVVRAYFLHTTVDIIRFRIEMLLRVLPALQAFAAQSAAA